MPVPNRLASLAGSYPSTFAVRPVCRVQVVAGRAPTGEVYYKYATCPSGVSYGRLGLPCTCPSFPNHRGYLVRP
jgi:hypothetical protein